MEHEKGAKRRDSEYADCFMGIFTVALLALGVVWPGPEGGDKIASVRNGTILVQTDAPFVLEDPASMPVDATLLSGSSEQTCLALAIYFEARSEPRAGQQAIGEVIVNRVRSEAYPDSVCDVVLQGGASKRYFCQFSFFCDGLPDRPVNRHAWKQANHIAWQVLTGGTARHLQDNVLHYHAVYVSPPWAETMFRVARIGKHLFYTLKGHQGRGITSG